MFMSIKEIVETSQQTNKSLSQLMLEQEVEVSGKTEEEVLEGMRQNLVTMEKAVARSITGDGVHSPTGLTGGDALKMQRYRQKGNTLSDDKMLKAVQNALGTNEVNAAMGVICATPTAGASGTIPGVLFSVADTLKLDEDAKIRFLLTSALFGMIVANNAMIAGAVGGCQAEVGSASAMAAAAAVEAAGGTPEQSAHAFSTALGNLLGLVCDPVAGLVEVPCVKRNAIGAGNALIAADMALAGIENIIPADETIEAMRKIGKQMPRELRETGLGGTAGTPTGVALKMRIFGQDVSLEEQ
ncbi:L-serine ammonia-lyase, iron-sulfur-dependent, subunit alpha [Atopobacter phocae]|uniref:L-serine ammonia-lyase, iron-sulfur-dependent, subunit alpha n=1 Tax=Atopobacter phocae TaxID=136492 RepID=UPI00046E9CE6|nr:L-serine ammonia-lyase, iron-sulfur-dependent, subunit alpha [Atopobacter phocae]